MCLTIDRNAREKRQKENIQAGSKEPSEMNKHLLSKLSSLNRVRQYSVNVKRIRMTKTTEQILHPLISAINADLLNL